MGSLHTSPNAYLNRIAMLAIVTLALAVAGPVSAEVRTASATERVSYADLDLGNPAGAKALLGRIESAARTACGGEPTSSPLTPRAQADFRACTREAIDHAVTAFGAPLVASLRGREANGAETTVAAR